MQYQLPGGGVIYMSVEEYLSLTDDELSLIAGCYFGDHPSHKMYYGNKARDIIIPDRDYDVDYNTEYDEPDTRGPINIDDLPDELIQ